MKFYIATRIEHADKHRALANELRQRGHEISYDWTTRGSVTGNADGLKDTAIAEATGVRDADCTIILLPGGRGTHVELGIAIGVGMMRQDFPRPILIVGDTGGLTKDTCALYHHPYVFLTERFEPVATLADVAIGIAQGAIQAAKRGATLQVHGCPRLKFHNEDEQRPGFGKCGVYLHGVERSWAKGYLNTGGGSVVGEFCTICQPGDPNVVFVHVAEPHDNEFALCRAPLDGDDDVGVDDVEAVHEFKSSLSVFYKFCDTCIELSNAGQG